MKLFIFKSLSFFILFIVILSMFLMNFGGYIDYFYEKFTTDKASSLIIGDSRAMQGIQPQIINKKLKDSDYELPIYNYAFTIAQAHIGPLYNKSILKKLKPDTKKGLFIISVTPWMLASKKNNKNENGIFKESGHPPHNMSFVNMNPNFEYFLKNYNFFHFKSVFKQKSKLHKNGWLEERNLPKDSLIFKKWKQIQLDIFSDFSQNYHVSNFRKKSLDTLIRSLKKKGSVFLLRTPIDNQMLQLENKFYNHFNEDMDSIASFHNIKFINYTRGKSKFKTYDGHHIDKFGGIGFTQSLCDSIKVSSSKFIN